MTCCLSRTLTSHPSNRVSTHLLLTSYITITLPFFRYGHLHRVVNPPFSRDTGGNLTKIKNSFKNVKGKEKEERSQIRFVLNAHEFLLHECRGTIEFIHRGE